MSADGGKTSPHGPEGLLKLGESWFLGGSRSAALAWAASVLALIAVLVWFFILSPYGAPAAPVYAEF
ncbi:MAG: hypothetical protein E7001_00330 [Coriobacteriaceae bacterium]|nr:hypothetical protein [Coriobacteriaceae bacterium]